MLTVNHLSWIHLNSIVAAFVLVELPWANKRLNIERFCIRF